jgi:hypothetical protein
MMTWWRIKTVGCGLLREEVSPGEGHTENYHIGTYPEKVMQLCTKRLAGYANLEPHELPDHFEKEEIVDFFVLGKSSNSISQIPAKRRASVKRWMRLKMIVRYRKVWGRAPYKEEVAASLNFVLNPIFKERSARGDEE